MDWLKMKQEVSDFTGIQLSQRACWVFQRHFSNSLEAVFFILLSHLLLFFHTNKAEQQEPSFEREKPSA